METLRQDVFYAFRMLLKSPAFTIVAVLSLAIGIGANSAIFSVTNALLLRPLPIKDADRLVIMWNRSPGLNVAQDWLSPGEYLDIRSDARCFEQVAATLDGSFNLTGEGLAEHVDGARVTSSIFPLFGATPALGRVFLAADDQPGAPPSVILSNGLWQRRFGGDAGVIGKTLVLNGNNFTVVGVMPADFTFNKEIMPTVNGIRSAEILLPLPFAESSRTVRSHEDFNIYGKLKPGITPAQAQAEMNTLTARMMQQYPANYPPNSGFTISVVPMLTQVVGDVRLTLWILFGAVAFVLLIACANVANLLLSRAAARQREIAIRTAVGADRARIIKQLLTESVLLGLMGGAGGLLIAFLSIRILQVLAPENLPRLGEISVDSRVMAFTFFVSLLAGTLFGLVPSLRASRVDLNEVLKDGARNSNNERLGHSRFNVRDLLVVSEVALSLILLIGAGLLIRSYSRIQNANPGFNPHNLLSMRLTLPSSKYKSQDAIRAFYRQTIEKVKQIPGVESAAITYSLPMSSVALAWEPLTIEGYVPPAGQNGIIANTRIVSPDYFRAMGIPLVQGRLFDDHDKNDSLAVTIVNENLANRFWPHENPIGKRLTHSGRDPFATVVGVVRDAKQYSAEAEPPITAFFPYEQYTAGSMFLLTRTSSDPVVMTSPIVREIHAVDSELPVFDVSSMDQRLYNSLSRRRFSMFLLTVFAAVALVLATVGIYGVISYSVNQRTREIGIRMALGAYQSTILRLVIKQSSILIAVGIAIGLLGSLFLTRLITSQLFDVSATDKYTFIGISMLLAAIGILASYIPARRASRVDPMVALRYE